MKEKSWRRNRKVVHGGEIMREEPWKRNHGGRIHHEGELMEEQSWKSTYGGALI